jgi:Family of unknown function (DUF5675)
MMTLTRISKGSDGIFGELRSDDGLFSCVSLEHAYALIPGIYNPKIPVGTYPCILGPHRLLGMNKSFDTFAVCGVPGHSGILFHSGNTNDDSTGCILLGKEIAGNAPHRLITESKETFELFMNYTKFANFQLVIQNKYI